MDKKKGLLSNLDSRQRLMVNIGAGVVGLTALVLGGTAIAKSDMITEPKASVAQYLALKSFEWDPAGYIENLNFNVVEKEESLLPYKVEVEQTAFALNESGLLNRQFRDYLFVTNAEGIPVNTGIDVCGPIIESGSIEQQLDVYSGIMEKATPEQQLEIVISGVNEMPADQYGSVLKAMGLAIYDQVLDKLTGGN